MKTPQPALLIFFCCITFSSAAQNLYSARGYWEESNKPAYKEIKDKEARGDSLNSEELTYKADYETYLNSYFERLSAEEKNRYAQMKSQWDAEGRQPPPAKLAEDFEWRTRDRITNALYGMYYGISVVAAADIDDAAAAGIPLITGGLWLLGPAINPRKYDGITQTTIRASNTGKLLGLVYGASLGMGTLGDDHGDAIFLMSSVASITLGEVGFQLQKKKQLSDGHVEMLRHYGLLGPWIGFATATAASNEITTEIAGWSLLTGGVAGLAIGHRQATKYNYTKGDVDAITSLATIGVGVGFTLVAEAFEDGSPGLILIPAATSIAGTVIAQRSVRGAHLTNKQGSVINLATLGSAMIALGILTIAETESVTAWIGVPSLMALAAHEIAFQKFKRENLLTGESLRRKHSAKLSMRFSPENYFINQKQFERTVRASANRIGNPVFTLKVTF